MRLLNNLGKLTLIAIAIVTSLPLLFVGWFVLSTSRDNATFATRLFSKEPVEISRVIGSKRWHAWSEGPFGCTYAIVEINQTTSEALLRASASEIGALGNTDSDDGYMWSPHPGFWQRTPVADYNGFQCDDPPRECCFSDLNPEDAKKIISGIREEGGWVSFNGEVTSFVLPKQSIIGTIRYGD